MAEVTAESPSTVLPEELMIEILSKVGLNNPLPLRCVCKLWNSLVVDPQFMKNHISRSITEITDLACKAFDRLQSLKSLQEEEGDEEAVEEDNAATEEDEGEGEDDDDDDDEEEDDDDYDYDDDDDDEEDVEEEEEDVEEEQSVMDKIAELRREEEVAPLDNLLKILKYIKGKFETIRDDLQAVEDRVKCFQNFLLVYLKSAKSSSSQL